MKEKLLTLLCVTVLIVSTLTGCDMAVSQKLEEFQGGSGTIDDPWHVATAEQLDMIHEHLDGHFVLTADIDLSDYGPFDPIGTFQPASDAEEDAETPNEAVAFMGSFDGGGYLISNITVSNKYENGVGLFGCVSGDGARVENLSVQNITADGGLGVGGIIGFVDSGVSVKKLTLHGDNTISGTFGVGGIIGAGFCDITDCLAEANVILNGNSSQGVGIVAGAIEGGNFENCYATGTVKTTGTGSYSIGGLAGCLHETEYARNCLTENVIITVGSNCSMIGGLAGHAGIVDGVTEITDCASNNITINASSTTERIGGLVGSGFYLSQFAQYYPEPTSFSIVNCKATGTISGGSIVGAAIGYFYDNSVMESCTTDVTINGLSNAPAIGADANSISLEELM